MLFGERVSLLDQRIISRLGDKDVREHIRAVFVPLILSKSTVKLEQRALGLSKSVVSWKPYQASHSEHHPAIESEKTAFNLVPCQNPLEKEMAQFLGRAPDVECFAKNAGPEALRIDYQTHAGRLSHYTPDFLVKRNDGSYVMLETKGRVDIDVPLKIRAAEAWCKAGSDSGIEWEYLYVSQEIFAKVSDPRLEMLFSLCEPSKQTLLQEKIDAPLSLEKGNLEKLTFDEFIKEEELNQLPPKSKKGVQEAIAIFKFLEKKSDVSYAAVFTPLLGSLDEAAKNFIILTFRASIPEDPKKQERFFEPDLSVLHPRDESFHRRQAVNLRRTLVENDGVMPMGLLKWCLEYATSPKTPPGGIFSAVKIKFEAAARADLLDIVNNIYSFRNEYIAHQEKELDDENIAKQAMNDWISGLVRIWKG
jgi:type III restriction enzyme